MLICLSACHSATLGVVTGQVMLGSLRYPAPCVQHCCRARQALEAQQAAKSAAVKRLRSQTPHRPYYRPFFRERSWGERSWWKRRERYKEGLLSSDEEWSEDEW